MKNFYEKNKDMINIISYFISFVSVLSVVMQLIFHTYSDKNFTFMLMSFYILMTIPAIISFKLSPLIKNKKVKYIIDIGQYVIAFLFIDIIGNLTGYTDTGVFDIFKNMGFIIIGGIAGTIIGTIIGICVKHIKYKHINKKLNEYKQKNDDDK